MYACVYVYIYIYTHTYIGIVYVVPWDHRACYGGMDWWYAMNRDAADVIARFRHEYQCEYLNRSEILERDPFYDDKPTRCRNGLLGCEGWLASFMMAKGVEFKPLPTKPWPQKR